MDNDGLIPEVFDLVLVFNEITNVVIFYHFPSFFQKSSHAKAKIFE